MIGAIRNMGNRMNTIGATILQQINTIDSRAMMAWGAKDIVYMRSGLKFKSSGLVKRKCYVYIQYDAGLDLYNIQFARIRKSEWIVDCELSMVFADGLVEHIDRYVG
jgi:hypothetical protein